MQVIYKNKDKRSSDRGTDTMSIVICAGRISEYLEGKYTRRSRRGIVGI